MGNIFEILKEKLAAKIEKKGGGLVEMDMGFLGG